MTVTFKQAVIVCLMTALSSSAIAHGQQGLPGNAPCQSQPTTLPAQAPLAADRLFALASPAVVKLTIKDEDDREIGIGSGFIVSFEKEKLDIQGRAFYRSTIITNYHVIRPAISIDVSFSDGQRGWVSQVIAEDEAADLAVLSASSLAEPKRALRLQKSANPPIGTKVYAIGSPQGLSNTLSEGLISGYRQRGKHEPWIQITAPISPGSSGGPLFSPEGSVLGVTTAFLSESQNLNFAVPAGEVLRLLSQPAKARPIWEGASIRKMEENAFLATELDFVIPLLRRRDGHSEQTYIEFLDEQVSAGDQLALLLKGRELYFSKEYDEAIAMLTRATKAEPGEYAYLAHYALAQALYRNVKRGVHFEDAIQPLRRAKELNPDFGPTFRELCLVYSVLDKAPELLVEAESLVRLMPRCYVGYQSRGEAWAELGREEAFERDFEIACDLRPHDPLLLFDKAQGYSSLGKLQEAVDTYRNVIELDADSFAAHHNLGIALSRLGKYDEAIKSYQQALGLFREDADYQRMIEDRIAECRQEMMRSP